MAKRRRRNRRRKKRISKLWLVLGITLGVFFACYIGFVIYFYQRFSFGTIINGIDYRTEKPLEVEEKLEAELADYELKIRTKENSDDNVIKAFEIDLSLNFDGKVTEIGEEQNPFLWFVGIFSPKEYEIVPKVIYNEEKLLKVYDALPCFRDMESPQNAYIDHTEDGFVLREEVNGNRIKNHELYDLVKEKLNAAEEELSVEKNDCYYKPTITTESEPLKSQYETIKKMTGTDITYDFEDRTEKIDGSTIHEWISIEGGEVVLSEEKAAEFVSELARKYNTIGTTRSFYASRGESIKVEGGNYGWRISQTEEKDELLQAIKTGTKGTRKPIYAQEGFCRAENDLGNTYIEVDLTKQHMWYYENGGLVLDTDVVTGNPYKEGTETPAVVAVLRYKQRNATLKGEDYETPVDYWMPVIGNVGIHDATWRTKFGGELYKTSGSHGCINTPHEVMVDLFERAEVGIPVIMHY